MPPYTFRTMRAAFPLAILFICTSLCAVAQNVSPPQPPIDPEQGGMVSPPPPRAAANGHITGHVLCDDTHRPARGALVMAQALPDPSGDHQGSNGLEMMAHVGTDGTYTIEHVGPGEYTVFAFTPGYLSSLQDMIAAGMGNVGPAQLRETLARNGTVSVRGQETATFDITLHRGAALSGRVTFSDGAPASQVTLVLENVNAKPPKDANAAQQQEVASAIAQRMFTHQNFETDDQGHFRLVGIQPGTYRLAATQPTFTPGDASGGDGMAMIITGIPDPHALRFYAGDTPHRASAKTFDLRAADDVSGIDITLPVDALHELHGTVTAKDGRTLNMGALTLTDNADPTLSFHSKLQRDGTFAFHQVPAGNYTLAASEARIGKPLNPNEPMAENFAQLQPTNAFADGSLTLLVKDADLNDLTLTLDEIPLPKPDAQAPGATSDEN